MKVLPVTILTGFLGSGKTTMVNKIMADNPDVKFAVIVNEFGDVGLESEFVETSGDEEVIELDNGCICCTVRGDLVEAIDRLLAIGDRVDYLIIEASGLSDPGPLAQTFMQPELVDKVRLDLVICMIDAVNVLRNLRHFNTAIGQVSYADVGLITKSEEVKPKRIEMIKRAVAAVNGHLKLYENYDDLPMRALLDPAATNYDDIASLKSSKQSKSSKDGHSQGSSHSHSHAHDSDSYDTVFFRSDKPLDHLKFKKFLEGLPENVIRGKGYVYFKENLPGQSAKHLLQLVGARQQVIAKPWGDTKKSTALLFIGENVDESAILGSLSDCEIS